MSTATHDPANCTDSFQQLAQTVEYYINSGNMYQALQQLSFCWQARAIATRGFGSQNRGHMEAKQSVQNLWSFLGGNEIPTPVQIQYVEPKTFQIAFGNHYIGDITAYGFRDAQTGQLMRMGGGKRKSTRKQRKSRKQRKQSKGTRRQRK